MVKSLNKLQYSKPHWPENQKRQNNEFSIETATKSRRTSPNGTNRFEGTDLEGVGITAAVLPDTQTFCSPVPVPCNLNHPARRRNKPRAGKRSQYSLQGRKVGAAQAPARTHSAPSPTSSPVSSTPKLCQRAAKGKPDKINGLVDSPGNSLRRRLFYGQADPMAHCDAPSATGTLDARRVPRQLKYTLVATSLGMRPYYLRHYFPNYISKVSLQKEKN